MENGCYLSRKQKHVQYNLLTEKLNSAVRDLHSSAIDEFSERKKDLKESYESISFGVTHLDNRQQCYEFFARLVLPF